MQVGLASLRGYPSPTTLSQAGTSYKNLGSDLGAGLRSSLCHLSLWTAASSSASDSFPESAQVDQLCWVPGSPAL